MSGPELTPEIRAGRPFVVIDDTDAAGRGWLMAAAQTVTTDAMAFVVRYSSGFVYVLVDSAICERLNLPPMVGWWIDGMQNQRTVTVDAVDGVTTGISAQDRATTARKLADPAAQAEDFTRPGHVMPVRIPPHVQEADRGVGGPVIDLVVEAGLTPALVTAEIVSDTDALSMIDGKQAVAFARLHSLGSVLLSDISVRR